MLLRVDLYQDRDGGLWLHRAGDRAAVSVPDERHGWFRNDATVLARVGTDRFAVERLAPLVMADVGGFAPSRLIATWDDGRIGPGNAAPSLEARAYLGL